MHALRCPDRSSLWLACLALSLSGLQPAHAQVAPDGSTGARSVPAACPPPAPTMTPERMAEVLKTAPDRGPLWRIEKNGRSSWLYGTAHVARLQWVFPGPGLLGAMRQSDILALELNPLDTESLKPLTEPPKADAVARILDGTRTARLARQIGLACLPPTALDNLRPAIRVATLLVLNGRKEGLYLDFGIDSMLAGMAVGLKKPIQALETAQDQLLLLAGRNEDEERRIVDSALDELESGKSRQQMVEMTQAWASADLDKLNAYPTWCQCMDKPEDKAFMKRMLDDRNVLIAQKIDRLHEGGQRVFTAVGVLHMIGERGLPTLMRAQGYRVEAVAHAPDRREAQALP
jgi:uncharacterized protein